jgi:hypothetical protein
MAKRNLGLGKSRFKKQKIENEDSTEVNKSEQDKEQLLTVELANEVNPDDPLSQLCGLWQTWRDGDRNNELILNGIINECDRILRNCVENGGNEEIKLNDNFYSIYAQSLSDIAKFKPDNEVKEWIENAFERIDEGFNKFGNDNIRLKFSKCNIILNRIAIEFVGQMNIDSKKDEFKGLNELFEEFINIWESNVKECEKREDLSIFKEEWILEILNIFDDLLDIIDKFGNKMSEVVDSDDEGEELEEAIEYETSKKGDKNIQNVLEEEDFQLSEDHPLYEIQHQDSYNIFWRDNMLKYRELMGEDADAKIKRSVYEKLGQSYLMEAEEPIAFFNSYQYDREEDDNEEDEDEEMKEMVENARKEGLKLVNEAVNCLRKANDEEDPKTWANIAEALITYANLLELESEEQENNYKEAEKLLRRANNATHGHYEDILNSLVKPDA